MSAHSRQSPEVASAASSHDEGASSDRLTLASVIVCALLTVPGLLAVLGIGVQPGGPLSELDRALKEISFGSGVRFWLGVAGTTMMGLLLLYPLRKLFGLGRFISVGTWFQIHAVLGLFGPLAILYHCNFGTGSTPANVALASVAIVVLSGLFGRFAYTRVSASYHEERKHAGAHLDEAIAELNRLQPTPSRSRLLDDLAHLITPPTGPDGKPAPQIRWTTSERARRAELQARATWLIDNQGPADGWSADRRREAKVRVHAALTRTFASLRRAARGGLGEWMAGWWRLLHLPVFLVAVGAVSIHVAKVWDMDAGGPNQAPAAAPALPDRSPPVAGSPIATRRVTTRTETVNAGESAPSAATAPPVPRLVKAPEPAQRPKPDGPSGAPQPQAEVPKPAAATAQAPSPAAMQPSTRPAAPEAPKPSPPVAGDPVRELAQKAVLDNTGKLDPIVVTQRLAQFKADPTFDHSKTRFPLVGKHLKNDCAQCHKTTLKDTPKTCVSCHKTDDVHRGRRPNCEQCHTPVDWGTLIKRE